MIKTQIGEIAGKIWDELDKNGEMSLAQLKKQIGGNAFLVQAAIGWLAREEKLNFIKKGNSIRITLN